MKKKLLALLLALVLVLSAFAACKNSTEDPDSEKADETTASDDKETSQEDPEPSPETTVGNTEEPDTEESSQEEDEDPDSSSETTDGKTEEPDVEKDPEEPTPEYNSGDIIKFGSYEQDNDTSNGKEEIEWIVLDKQDGKALVISKYALDSQPYHEEWGDVTWETCTLRNWLNNEFINAAFSDEEKTRIPTVTVSADVNPDYNTDPGNATQDKVFLLSIDEVNNFLIDVPYLRGVPPTSYAVNNGVATYKDLCAGWWLRSPGSSQREAAYVAAAPSGLNLKWPGWSCGADYVAVRPAMWINIEV